MSIAFSPARCHVSLGALQRNFRRLSRYGRLMPVIKADAYGHGLAPVANALAAAGAERFAVSGAEEGAALREAGHGGAILLLTGCQTDDERACAKALRLWPAIHDFESLAACAALGGELDIALKFDSGMGRLGFAPDDLPELLERLRSLPQLKPVMVFSHFASADSPQDAAYAQGQMRSFDEFCGALREIWPGLLRSLGNSAALFAKPHAVYDALRPGIALYGGDPLRENGGGGCGLEWAMSLSAPVLQTKRLKKGQSVSYGRLFTAPEDMTVAVVACGYAQGLSRALSGRCEMLARGRRLPQIGRICMGMSILDARKMPDLRPGETVYPLGGEAATGEKCVDADELAAKLGTISYEILCAMGSLNQRVYEG